MSRCCCNITRPPCTRKFRDINASSSTYVHALVLYDTAEHSDIVSPEMARTVSFSLKNVTGGALTCNECKLTVTFKDISGCQTTEDLLVISQEIPAGATITVYGSKAVRKISKVKIDAAQPDNNNWNFSVGIYKKIGFDLSIRASTDIFAARLNSDDIAVPTIDVENMTFDAGDIVGGDDWELDFVEVNCD
jgi:hypothetical protein